MRIGVSAVGVQLHGTGVDRYLFETLRHLVQSSHAFVIFGQRDAIPQEISEAPNVTIVEVHPRWHFGVRRIVWHQTTLLLHIARHKLDVIWIPNNRLIVMKNAPVVMTIHDLAEFAIPGKYDPMRMFYRSSVMRLAMNRVDSILTDSRNSMNDLHRLMGVPLDKLAYAHLGPTPPHAELPEPAAKHVMANYGVRAPFVLYVGRLEQPAKNLIASMDVVAEVRKRTGMDLQFVLVGGDSWRAHLIREHAATQSYDFVKFTGYVPDADLHAFYKCAEVLLFLSLYEGFGLPPLEAMAAGLPVVCSNVSSLPEVVGDAAISVDPTDNRSAANALEVLLTNPTERAARVSAGLEQARRFSWESTAATTLAVLERSSRKRADQCAEQR